MSSTPGPARGDVLLQVRDLVVEFPVGRSTISAVSGISFDVERGETLGIVGESGCGKSSVGRAIMQIPPPTSGDVVFDDVDLTAAAPATLREVRTRMQMIFQDPVSSLNPRRSVRDSVLEPLEIWQRGTRSDRERRVDELLDRVGIDPRRAAESRPHEFSGGQCQRIAIARSLVLDPDLIICDEPVSALDVSVQAQVINLLQDLKEEFGLTLIFIAHDLGVVRNVSDRVAVMYLGALTEIAPSDELYRRPGHPYTGLLLDAVPVPDPDAHRPHIELAGEPPSPITPPAGCRFHPRCPRATERCSTIAPQLQRLREHVEPVRFVACHHPLEPPPEPVAGVA